MNAIETRKPVFMYMDHATGNLTAHKLKPPMSEKETLQAFRDVFPGSQVVPDIDAIPMPEKTQLYCNYGNPYVERKKRYAYGYPIRAVSDDVCKDHLSSLDEFCLNDCECEYSKSRLCH